MSTSTPIPTSGPFTVRLSARTTVAPFVVDLLFDVVHPASLLFRAGQFATLTVGTDAQGRNIRRSYSIASLSDRGERLRFIIRVIPGGVASDFFTGMPLGAEVEMTGPHGFFVLADTHPGDVVFGATGTGIAPVIPMLGELTKRPQAAGSGHGRRIVYWGMRNESELFLRDEIEGVCAATGASLCTYLSRPAGAWPGLSGRITPAVLEATPSFHSPTFYLVGNGAMIEELKRGLVAVGIDRKKQIRTEAFFD
jgi:CDP-4-dehydro-6-deoxyglucose reductase